MPRKELKVEENLDPQIGLIWGMLEDVRKVSLKGIEGLTKEQLFEEPISGEYPIGAYLFHFAEAELFWLEIASETEQPKVLKEEIFSNNWFDPSEENPKPPTKPLEIEDYLKGLQKVRNRLKDFVFGLKDSDLEKFVPLQKTLKNVEEPWEISIKWILYHLIEHEAHHRGQMLTLIRKGKL